MGCYGHEWVKSRFLCLCNLPLYVIFSFQLTSITNIRDYWDIFWNIQVCDFIFFTVFFLLLLPYYLISLYASCRNLCSPLIQVVSLFFWYASPGELWRSIFLFNRYLSCTLSTFIELYHKFQFCASLQNLFNETIKYGYLFWIWVNLYLKLYYQHFWGG